MTNQVDFLDEWKTDMLLKKYRYSQQHNPAFLQIEAIHQTLREFYGPNEFIAYNFSPHNWTLHVLANKQITSLKLLGEQALLLRLQKEKPDLQSFRLKANSGQINYKELNEKLFELFLYYIFDKAGFNPSTNEAYTDSNGQHKPIDLSISINGQLVLIEATKFYDPFKQGLLEISRHLGLRIHKLLTKNGLKFEEHFSGYLSFKKTSLKDLKRAQALFQDKVNDYINKFRTPGSNIIDSALPYDDESLKLVIEPVYVNNFPKYSEINSSFSQSRLCLER